MEAALPHGDTLPNNNLNEDDKEKLMNAIGRTVTPIKMNQLIEKIDSSENQLSGFVFWKVDCPDCMTQHQLLQKLQNEVGESKLKLVFVNIDPVTEISEVNTSIRAQGLFQDVYILSDLTISQLPNRYQPVFSTTLPTILFVNNSDGTFIHYDYLFDYDELFAITQPLLM